MKKRNTKSLIGVRQMQTLEIGNHKINVAFITEYKELHACMDCKKRYPACCMDFDHRPGEPKTDAIANLINYRFPLEIIKLEMESCDLVCANCHRIRTTNRKRNKGD